MAQGVLIINNGNVVPVKSTVPETLGKGKQRLPILDGSSGLVAGGEDFTHVEVLCR